MTDVNEEEQAYPTVERRSIPEKVIRIDQVQIKTFETRIEGVKDATQRSRFVFIVVTIISSAILITLWNSTLSWDSWIPSLPRDNGATSVEQQRIEFNKDEIIKEWIKSQVISVGLLGIRVSGTDLAVLGSGSLIVAMTWFFFCIRRENRAIVTLLQDINKDYQDEVVTQELCRMVYHGIVQSIVFIDMGGGDEPEGGIRIRDISRSYLKKFTPRYQSKNLRSRVVIRYLFFLPPFAILMVVFSDLLSLIGPSPIRSCQAALISCFWHDPYWFFYMMKIFIFEIIAVGSIYYTWRICRVCREFSRITGATIEEFGAVHEFYRIEENRE